MGHSKEEFKKVYDMLHLYKATFLYKSGREHDIWLLPNGKKFTIGTSMSDRRAPYNTMQNLKHLLGLVDSSPKDTEGERRERKSKGGGSRYAAPVEFVAVPSMQDKLKQALMNTYPFLDLAEEAEKQVAPVVLKKIRGHRLIGSTRAKAGAVRVCPQGIIDEANRLIFMYGEHAGQDYLRRWREGQLKGVSQPQHVETVVEQPKEKRMAWKPPEALPQPVPKASVGVTLDVALNLAFEEAEANIKALEEYIADQDRAKTMLAHMQDVATAMKMAGESMVAARVNMASVNVAISSLNRGKAVLDALTGNNNTSEQKTQPQPTKPTNGSGKHRSYKKFPGVFPVVEARLKQGKATPQQVAKAIVEKFPDYNKHSVYALLQSYRASGKVIQVGAEWTLAVQKSSTQVTQINEANETAM